MGKTVFVDLTHPFSAEIPRWPYFDKPDIVGAHSMAKGGVLTQKITCTMHTGTHCDAPRHVMEYEFDGRRARYSHEMPIDAYTGQAIVLKIDIEPWGLITDKHLDAACEKYGINQADLEGKKVSVQSGTTADAGCTDAGLTVDAYAANADAKAALTTGKVDAWVVDNLTAIQMVEEGDGLVILEENMTEEPYAFAFAFGSEDLVTEINTILEKLINDGTIEKIFADFGETYVKP